MSDLCIMVAPNGARRTKADHQCLPISPPELADCALACFNEGAGAIHLHVRDSEGRHTLDAVPFRAAIAAIEQGSPDMVIQTTTEATGVFSFGQQVEAVSALRPSFISFALGEMLRDGEAAAERFLEWTARQGTAIQFILYTPEDVSDFARRWREGRLHLSGAPRLLLVVGRYSATQDSSPLELDALVGRLDREKLREHAVWMTCAFGRGEMDCLERTIAAGGHARVGFENAIVDRDGKPACDNAERVRLVVDIANRLGRPIAQADRARAILGVNQGTALLEHSN